MFADGFKLHNWLRWLDYKNQKDIEILLGTSLIFYKVRFELNLEEYTVQKLKVNIKKKYKKDIKKE